MSAASICASMAAELIREKSESLVIVVGYGFHEESESTMLCPVLVVDGYVAEANGEVVPDYIPALVKATLDGKTEEVFHPPDNEILPVYESDLPPYAGDLA